MIKKFFDETIEKLHPYEDLLKNISENMVVDGNYDKRILEHPLDDDNSVEFTLANVFDDSCATLSFTTKSLLYQTGIVIRVEVSYIRAMLLHKYNLIVKDTDRDVALLSYSKTISGSFTTHNYDDFTGDTALQDDIKLRVLVLNKVIDKIKNSDKFEEFLNQCKEIYNNDKKKGNDDKMNNIEILEKKGENININSSDTDVIMTELLKNSIPNNFVLSEDDKEDDIVANMKDLMKVDDLEKDNTLTDDDLKDLLVDDIFEDEHMDEDINDFLEKNWYSELDEDTFKKSILIKDKEIKDVMEITGYTPDKSILELMKLMKPRPHMSKSEVSECYKSDNYTHDVLYGKKNMLTRFVVMTPSGIIYVMEYIAKVDKLGSYESMYSIDKIVGFNKYEKVKYSYTPDTKRISITGYNFENIKNRPSFTINQILLSKEEIAYLIKFISEHDAYKKLVEDLGNLYPVPVPKEEIEDEFTKICKELIELHKAKNSDYGDSFNKTFEEFGIVSPLTRMSDKFNRVKNIVLNKDYEQLIENESIIDNLMDLASYTIMTIMLLK